jgi:hypothetical protein
MPSTLTTEPYPPATLLDCDQRELASGEADVDTKTGFAEFFPSGTVDERVLLERTTSLRMADGASYAVRRIRRCEAVRLGRTSPHYELEIGG